MDLTVNEKCGVRWYEVGGVGDGDWWRLDCEFSDRVHMGDGAAAKLAVTMRKGVGADGRGLCLSLLIDPPLTAYVSWVFGKM